MRIGIAGPFNPAEYKGFFPNCEVPEINRNASSVQALVKSFVEAGHNVSVFTVNENNVYQEFISDKIKIYTVPFRLIPGMGILKIDRVNQLRKSIRQHLSELDVLHAQWTYEYAYAAKAFTKELPVFCTVRDWCPYIMSVLNNNLLGKIGWRIRYYMFRRVMSDGGIHFIANSEYTKLRIVSDYPQKEVVIIPNSIKKEYILTQRKSAESVIKLISIANGIFDPRKNIINLLRAFKLLREKYQDATLMVVGKYSESHSNYNLWKEDGLLDGVILTGQLNHEDVITQIDNSTIMIHPSLEETFGNILLEAMARRVPVIGGNEAGAVPMVLGNGKYGVCCDVTEPKDIYQAIIFLMDMDKVKLLVNNATQHLLNTFASDVVCENHVKEYSKYLNYVE